MRRETANPIKDYISQYSRSKITQNDAELLTLAAKAMMSNKDEAKIARRVLSKVVYATLATANGNAMPWNAPVYCAYDKNYVFYWISARQCVHSKNIEENPNIAIVVYDSTVPEGMGIGVYIKAVAELVEDPKEIKKGLEVLYRRKGKPAPNFNKYVDAPRMVYRAIPSAVWINNLREKGEDFRSLRLEISLK